MSIIKKYSRMLSRSFCVALISLVLALPNYAQADPDAAPILLGKTMGEWSENGGNGHFLSQLHQTLCWIIRALFVILDRKVRFGF